jgi:hypothetical protein
MGLVNINDNPSRRELRQFAAIWFPLACIALALVVYSATKSFEVGAALALAGLVGGAVGYVKPAFIHPIYLLWMYAAFPIGWMVSHLILLVIFYAIFTPVAVVMRLVGYDPMRRRLQGADKSDWIPVGQSTDRTEYFRQF